MHRQPIKLQQNRIWRPFVGGKLLDRWQGRTDEKDGHLPEEWVASVVSANNPKTKADEGLSRISGRDDTQSLKSLIEAEPATMLGERHFQKFGADPALLVKVLDSYTRLMIQVHPDDSRAQHLFRSPFGKTEAWYILGGREVNGEPPYVLAGFKPGISREHWIRLFREQDVEGMLAAMHKIPVTPGQVYYVTGGFPHAMGSGVFFLEIMQPTDYTIRVERFSPDNMWLEDEMLHQGLGLERMFDCFDYEGLEEQAVLSRCLLPPKTLETRPSGRRIALISPEVTPYFSLHRLEITDRFMCNNAAEQFSVVVVLSGQGSLKWEHGEIPLNQADELFIPACMNRLEWRAHAGRLDLVQCFPPMSAREEIV